MLRKLLELRDLAAYEEVTLYLRWSPLATVYGLKLFSSPGTKMAAGRAGGEGVATFGVVAESGRRVALTFSGGDVELAYDACAQAVLPWSGAAEDWVTHRRCRGS